MSRTFESRRKERAGLVCGVPGCASPARPLRNYCVSHANRFIRYGHPEGGPIPKRLTGPVARAVLVYLQTPEARDHPAIRDGLNWCVRWLLSGEYCGENWQGMSPKQVVSSFLFRLERAGVTAEEVLSAIVAVAYVRMFIPGRIKSDAHARFCIVRAVFNLRPWPTLGQVSQSGSGTTRTSRLSYPRPRAIECAYGQVPPQLLVLAEKIASVIRKYEERLAFATNPNNGASPIPEMPMENTKDKP